MYLQQGSNDRRVVSMYRSGSYFKTDVERGGVFKMQTNKTLDCVS